MNCSAEIVVIFSFCLVVLKKNFFGKWVRVVSFTDTDVTLLKSLVIVILVSDKLLRSVRLPIRPEIQF
jgi:hypothetical protein